MKVENYKPTKSSFLSIEKDMSIIIDSIFSNKTLLKLLMRLKMLLKSQL